MTLARLGAVAVVALMAIGGSLMAPPCVAPLPPSEPPGPCVWAKSIAPARGVGHVFEGIVVDDWTETFIDGQWRLRRLRVYRCQVLRDWTLTVGGHRDLEQGWYEGERYMRGMYRSFERGRRYLVVATTHDSPAH